MKPELNSNLRLAMTRSKAKMYEYNVPLESHIVIPKDPAELFIFTIGLLGEVAARINSNQTDGDEYKESKENLYFSAQFFDAFIQSQLNHEIDNYLILIGASAYYLCDFPGSSNVLIKKIIQDNIDLEASGLENLILWLLKGEILKSSVNVDESCIFSDYISVIEYHLKVFYDIGRSYQPLIESLNMLRQVVYESGTARELLFADIIGAIIRKRLDNSTWNCLPQFTGLSLETWTPVIGKSTFIKELWPAQKLLGEKGVFQGQSAVIQMPTSAGKTKSTEIIIRSSFLSERSNFAVIVAPFRALCHEIKNSMVLAFAGELVQIDEPSDVVQIDFDISEWVEEEKKQIVIVTPEKLLYILRHSPVLAENIGLIIYDEGHQFDSGTRGVTYELLLASLKRMIPEHAQTVLISAVISNAREIGSWLHGESTNIVEGSSLSPTYRTIAFTSWLDTLGQVKYVSKLHPDSTEFFVPRILESSRLSLRDSERKARLFPEKKSTNDIALFLGLKLVRNGAVGIFCGRKDTVSNLCARIIEVYKRDFHHITPLAFSNEDEIIRLHRLHLKHFGRDNHLTNAAEIGIFAHSANTPHGLRLAIEYALEKGLAKYVICTSTLAQGVNLPLRYLIVTSIYQAGERIKVRDFHNLIGRAGRSGMHTEGSIIFADPSVYDLHLNRWKNWKWNAVKEILDQENSEPCDSMIASLLYPFENISMDPLEFIEEYLSGKEAFSEYIANKINLLTDDATEIKKQISLRLKIIAAIESYLMSNAIPDGSNFDENNIANLAKETFAYHSLSEENKAGLVKVFKQLALFISNIVPQPEKRQLYGKILFGIHQVQELEEWLFNHFEDLNNNEIELLDVLWTILLHSTDKQLIHKSDDIEAIKVLANMWINGISYGEMYEYIQSLAISYRAKTQIRQYKLEHMVEICEGTFSYDMTLVMGAIINLIEFYYPERGIKLVKNMNLLQKKLKYGVGSAKCVTLYELGFSDRCLVQDLERIIDTVEHHKTIVKVNLSRNEEYVREILAEYPNYYSHVFTNIILTS